MTPKQKFQSIYPNSHAIREGGVWYIVGAKMRTVFEAITENQFYYGEGSTPAKAWKEAWRVL